MPVRHRELGDELASPQPKRCRHCDDSCSPCGGSEGSGDRASWRVTLDHDLVETLSAIYPEWFKPQHRSRAASPATPHPDTSPDEDANSSGMDEMGRQSGSGTSEGGSSPRVSPPKVVVDDSPLQPAMGKHKESLKVKLMMRRPINQLVAQGIMPPLKTPPAYFEQCKQLERAKTGDLLKAKIQRRPDRQELERRHILEQESHVDPSLAEKQRMLKKARLADQLNDQLSHRPGPLELIKKNILHTEEDIETAVKSGILAFKATSEGACGRPQHPSSYCGPPDEISPSPSPPSTLSPASVASPPQHPAPGKDKNRKKNKQKQQPKERARFKFHEYKGPPNAQKASSPPGSVETPYELLLQQQQLLLQLMLPASPAPSSAASDTSEHNPPPPPPPPAPPLARFEDMKVSDLRAECKKRNLHVSGPKQQLLDRLRPYLIEKEEPPRSPPSVASITSIGSIGSIQSVASPDSTALITSTMPNLCDNDSEDIVASQRRQIEELERKLDASRRQLEAVRREAAGAAASDQGRRLLQAHLCVTQLRAQLDALQSRDQQPRYLIAAPAPAQNQQQERLVRLFTVASDDPNNPKPANQAYILNGVKVVPIAILPTTTIEPERVAPPPPPPPPPMPPTPAPVRDNSEDSQIMDDVLEILVENGELPASAVRDNYLSNQSRDDLQRELDNIQNEIMSHATSQQSSLPADLLSTDFSGLNGSVEHTDTDHDFFGSLLGEDTSHSDDRCHTAMDIGDEPHERMSVTPLPNGDLLDATRSFDDMDDLSLPSFHNEESRPEPQLDLKDFGIDLSSSMAVDGEPYVFANMFGRGHVAPRDPLLAAAPALPAPRPAAALYSWDRLDFDAT